MTGARPLEVGVAELLRRPGTRREVVAADVVGGLAITTAGVIDGAPVEAELVLEAIAGSVVAEGVVRAPWVGECRRCLEPVTGVLETDVREVFEHRPTEGETYRLQDDHIDLEPLVRDAVLLALPLAPLCAEGCEGPAPEDFPTSVEGADEGDVGPGPATGGGDPRWAALDELRFDAEG